MVHYIGVETIKAMVASFGAEQILAGLTDAIEADFRRWEQFEKIARPASHSPHGVIELMPATDGDLYAFKYVNGHPGNAATGRLTVTGLGVLADVATGYPLLISEMTILTALRTAATSVLAARYLARPDSRTLALIGLGAQSEFQALAFKAIGIERLRVYDIDRRATEKFIGNMRGAGFSIEPVASAAAAADGADIVTTETADKRHASVLTADMIHDGQHINAIGGDCPGKTELHPGALKRGTVFVEFEPQTRVEGDIQQLPADFPVTELWRVITGMAPGRRDVADITIFDSVGFAIEDFATLRYMWSLLATMGAPTLDLVPALSDSRDLFGFMQARPVSSQRRGLTLAS